MSSATGTHMHKCYACDVVWEHPDGLCALASNETNDAAHSCPKCGTQNFIKYLGYDNPAYRAETCAKALPV